MEHTEAMEKMMAEQYLLGELLEEDRDAFEEHFFGCAECAAAVRDGAALLATGRVIERERPKVIPFPRRFQSLRAATAAAAAAVLVTIGGYQTIVIPPMTASIRQQSASIRQQSATIRQQSAQIERQSTMHIAKLWPLESDSQRGDPTKPPDTVVARPDEPIGLTFTVTDGTHPRYRCEIRDAAGLLRHTQIIDATMTNDSLLLTIPPGVLPEGDYKLVVSGEPHQSGDETTSYPFRIRRS